MWYVGFGVCRSRAGREDEEGDQGRPGGDVRNPQDVKKRWSKDTGEGGIYVGRKRRGAAPARVARSTPESSEERGKGLALFERQPNSQ